MAKRAFTGRDRELQYLEELWNSKGPVRCCVWGRRRIGKSSLLDEFSKGKRTLYMQAICGSYYENLSTLAMDISAFRGRDIGELRDLTHLMSTVEEICLEEHTLVVIDELPYLLDSAPQAASVIQKSLDRGLKDSDCMFIICGSSISVMRRETENYDRPLYGRFDHRLQIDCIGLEESRRFNDRMDTFDSLKWYATVGGIPQYLLSANDKGYEYNVAEQFLGPLSQWRDDAPQAILQEFKGNRNYTGAVKCIADGSVRQSEIADKMCIDRAACKRILDGLEYVGIIEKRHPMAGAPKKPIYRIRDPFIAFHYTVISRNQKLIETSASPNTVYEMLRNKIDSHLGNIFEILCAQWLETHFSVIEIGSWWGRDADGDDVDIDIVAKVADKNNTIYTLACECKFGRNPIGFTPLNTLCKRCDIALIRENVRYVLFSAGGFKDEVYEYARENGIILIDGEMMMGLRPVPIPKAPGKLLSISSRHD